MMKRREALAVATTIVGGTIVGAEVFLSGCTASENPSGLFSNDDVNLLDEIGETILPESDQSPGAKAARIGKFMKTIVTDCYDKNESEIFIAGLKEVETTANEKYGRKFVELSNQKRNQLLTNFDRTSRDLRESEGLHFFTMMKQLTIWGYFSSEIGATNALRYNPIPGRFDGCIPYEAGDRAWA